MPKDVCFQCSWEGGGGGERGGLCSPGLFSSKAFWDDAMDAPTLAGEALGRSGQQPAGPTPTVSTGCELCLLHDSGRRGPEKQTRKETPRANYWPRGQCCQLAYKEMVVEVSDGC